MTGGQEIRHPGLSGCARFTMATKRKSATRPIKNSFVAPESDAGGSEAKAKEVPI